MMDHLGSLLPGNCKFCHQWPTTTCLVFFVHKTRSESRDVVVMHLGKISIFFCQHQLASTTLPLTSAISPGRLSSLFLSVQPEWTGWMFDLSYFLPWFLLGQWLQPPPKVRSQTTICTCPVLSWLDSQTIRVLVYFSSTECSAWVFCQPKLLSWRGLVAVHTLLWSGTSGGAVPI